MFGGRPREILEIIKNKEVLGVTSPVLLAELMDVLSKKFKYPKSRVLQVERKMKKILRVIYPIKTINAVRDADDNRVLEAAVEGKCGYIVTGDGDLLSLKNYGGIKIITPVEFWQQHLKHLDEAVKSMF